MNSNTVKWADVPQIVEHLKAMKTIEVAMAYRSADFNLYGNSVMMLTLAELERRAKKIPEEVTFTLKQGLKTLRNEVYASEPYDQDKQYVAIDAALAWLEG